MGDGIKRPSASEEKNRPVVRKSLVASRRIVKGEAFSAENINVKRPGAGISPMRFDEVLGRIAARNFDPDEMIEL
jgi:sialic acid synthase SpsE